MYRREKLRWEVKIPESFIDENIGWNLLVPCEVMIIIFVV